MQDRGKVSEAISMTSESFTRVAKASDLANNSSVAVEVNGKSILVCKSQDKISAIINKCSHADEKLECGRIKNGWIACPVHGARFTLADGKVLNHPATVDIETFPVRVVDDWIEVQA
jgi:3-phenylpropionate/trans-cinnamate dioxygenase ferredoxin subunit